MGEKLFTRDQARGMLVGLAVGDAVGTTVEFAPRGSFPLVTDMVGGGPFNLKPGQWTDDTSMALCLGDSLVARGGWDPADCMRRFVNWRDYGLNSATGECFDIGMQTSEALSRFLDTGDPYSGPEGEDQSGNGGLMRLAPAVIAFGSDREQALVAAQAQSRLTHASPSCLRHAASLAEMLLSGEIGETPAEPPTEASGWVVHTMQAVTYALGRGRDFEATILEAVNLGSDADTVGAIAGQVAGRIWGYEVIPAHWRARLQDEGRIRDLADALYDLVPAPLVTG